MKIEVVSGGFDPLHPGHTRMFKAAKELADKLIVGINSDEWLIRKKGNNFQPADMREELVLQNKYVDETLFYKDNDNTSTELLKLVKEKYTNDTILYCNGGDRVSGNVPEEPYCTSNNIDMVYGVGGTNKYSSSSHLLERWTKPMYNRPWGKFYILSKGEEYQVKELLVDPGKELSQQYHLHRTEVWKVIDGTGELILDDIDTLHVHSPKRQFIKPGDSISIPLLKIHKLKNIGKVILRIIEIQRGKYLEEDDIIRLDRPDGY